MTGTGETLPSAEVHTTVGTNGAVKLAWGDVANARATGSTAARPPAARTSTSSRRCASLFDDGLDTSHARGAAHDDASSRRSSRRCRSTSTPPRASCRPRSRSCRRSAPATSLVTGSAGNYSIQFTGALGHRAIALLGGATSSLRSNGINAIVTMDGGSRRRHVQREPDRRPHELADQRLRLRPCLRRRRRAHRHGHRLPRRLPAPRRHGRQRARVRRADQRPDAADAGRDRPVERINYNQNLESIVVNGGNGDDQFYMDDTRASITVNGDEGNDFFQIGQLFRSRRTPALAGVAPEDVFATIETTQGWLSNGISKPMTINGGVGNDNFIVFHNLDTLEPVRRRRQRQLPRPGVRARRLAGRPPRAHRPERRRRRRPDPVRGRRAGQHRRRRRLRHGRRHRHRVQRRLRDHRRPASSVPACTSAS